MLIYEFTTSSKFMTSNLFMHKKPFYFFAKVIQDVRKFKYLDIIFSRSDSIYKAKKNLCEQSQIQIAM